jgi:hypothetical protein
MGRLLGRVAIALGVIVAAMGCGSRTLPGIAEVPGDGGSIGNEGGSGDGSTNHDSAPTCTVHGGYCVTDAECCNKEKCAGNSCGGMPVCQHTGQSCMRNRDCCMGQGPCAGGVCGGKPPPCQPDGTPCRDPLSCCSMTCSNGACGGGPCQPDGTSCMSSTQCCSNQCTNNVCGGVSACMAIGMTQCDICTAQSCCPQLMACQQDAMCAAYLQCIAQCEQQGNSGITCSQGQCAMFQGALRMQLDGCAGPACFMECM